MPDVVDHPHRHAAGSRVLDRAAHDLRGVRREMEVVLREVERAPRRVEELDDLFRHVERALTPVGQRPHLERAAQRTVTRRPTWRQRPAWKRSIRVFSTG